jgi:hypothetical protein
MMMSYPAAIVIVAIIAALSLSPEFRAFSVTAGPYVLGTILILAYIWAMGH